MIQFAKKQLKPLFQKIGLLEYYYSLYPQQPIYIPTIFSYLRISRWVVYLHFRLRMLYYVIRNGFRLMRPEAQNTLADQPKSHLAHVVDRNYRSTHFTLPFSRRRTEHLIYILHSIPSVNKEGKLLSIGPRNEGDLILLQAHGFKNVEGLDLFSYSPRIRVMDMHHMDYPDNTFDIISCGWVVRYSYDIRACVKEMVRVSKDGAHIAIGFSMNPDEGAPPPSIGSLLHGGVDELLGYFQPHVGYVYWRLEDRNMDETNLPEHTNSVVLRVKKSS
jgi:hypothetical protein